MQHLIRKHNEILEAGFEEKVFPFCQGKMCEDRGVEAKVLDSNGKLWCRACHRNGGVCWAISTYLDVTPEAILKRLELERVKDEKIAQIQKIENRMVNELKTKAAQYRKCIEALQPTTYIDLINRLIAAKENITNKTKATVTGADIHQLKMVCDDFDNMVANKEDSQEVKNIKSVIHSFHQLELKFYQQLTDLLHFLPIPDQKVRLICGGNWQDIAAEIKKIEAPVESLRLYNEYQYSELFTKSFGKVIEVLQSKKDHLKAISFYFNRDFKLSAEETQLLVPLMQMGKSVEFNNKTRMLDVNDYKLDFKDVGPAFNEAYKPHVQMPYKG